MGFSLVSFFLVAMALSACAFVLGFLASYFRYERPEHKSEARERTPLLIENGDVPISSVSFQHVDNNI